MKTALVTGCCGFIGTALVNRLRYDDWRVFGLDDFSTGDGKGLPHDVAVTLHDVAREFPTFPHCDTVFHLAAVSRIGVCEADPDRATAVNFHGTVNAVVAAEGWGAKVVFASTCAASDPALSAYARTKRSAEEILRVSDVRVAVIRPFNVYGRAWGSDEPSDGPTSTVVARFLAARDKGEPLVVHGDGDQRRDFVHVSDVVEALVTAATATTDRDHYDLGTGTNYSVNEVATLVGGPVVHTALPPGQQRDTLADPRRMVALGWSPRYNLREYVRSRTGRGR